MKLCCTIIMRTVTQPQYLCYRLTMLHVVYCPLEVHPALAARFLGSLKLLVTMTTAEGTQFRHAQPTFERSATFPVTHRQIFIKSHLKFYQRKSV